MKRKPDAGQLPYRLEVTEPAGARAFADYRRHIAVEGSISGESPLPEDAVLTVRLSDGAGNVVRETRRERKACEKLALPYSGFLGYPEGYDDGFGELRKYGFPPLAVDDETRPEDSIRDATVKCFFDDTCFKTFFVAATDPAHGLFLPDGMNYTDHAEKPYDLLPMGDYRIAVTLSDGAGNLLGMTEKELTVGKMPARVICRFHPDAHRVRMSEWSRETGCPLADALIPGYLNPYLGNWLYHMGLLKMYRAGDVAVYAGTDVRMFLYDVTEDSTSYATELAYLQTVGRVGDPRGFRAFCYDIGEAAVGIGKSYERAGKIIELPADVSLRVCRIDLVNASARENEFYLDERTVGSMICEPDGARLAPKSRIAVMGVVRPWQMDPADFTLCDDNTYEIGNRVETLVYTLTDGKITERYERKPMLERFDGGSIGKSVFEFYNLLEIGQEFAGKTVTVSVEAFDTHGNALPAGCTFRLMIGNGEK